MHRDSKRITWTAKKLRRSDGDGAEEEEEDLSILDMLEFAVSEIGISPSEFWSLSWYEYGLYLLRHKKSVEKENDNFENGWAQTRIMWALTFNINRGKSAPVKPEDLIRLRSDKKQEKQVSQRLTPDEVRKRFNIKKDEPEHIS